MVYLTEYNNKVSFKGDKTETKLIKDKLTVFDPNARFSQLYKRHKWDGYRKFYSSYNYFYIGFKNTIIDMLETNGVNYTLTNNANLFEVDYLSALKSVSLYKYQDELFNAFIDDFSRFGIFNLSVNYGKSYIIAKIIEHLKLPTLILVHRKTLVLQLYKTLTNFFNSVGVCIDGKYDIKPITVGTIQTISKLDIPDSYYDILLVDEVHRASSKTYQTFLRKMNSYYRYGFTGTANKSNKIDNMKVQSQFGDILFEATMDYTVKIGKSAKPKVFLIKYHDTYKPLKYQDAYNYHIVNGKLRNNIIVELTEKLIQQGKSVLIMVNFIEHGELLQEKLNIPFIYGENDISKIQKTLQDFNNRKEKSIIISTIGDEGLNIARADAVILTGAGKSQIRTIQRIGRALRTYKGKKNVEVYDFMDMTDDTLLSHSLQRIKTYKEQNIEIEEITYKEGAL